MTKEQCDSLKEICKKNEKQLIQKIECDLTNTLLDEANAFGILANGSVVYFEDELEGISYENECSFEQVENILIAMLKLAHKNGYTLCSYDKETSTLYPSNHPKYKIS